MRSHGKNRFSLQKPMTLEIRFRAHSTRIRLAADFHAVQSEVK
jgi:hypothetical protein